MASAVVATATSSSSATTSITVSETRTSAPNHLTNDSIGNQAPERNETAQRQNQPQHHNQHYQNQQHQKHAQEDSKFSATQAEGETVASQSEPPLPADLRRILREVAKTGACSWMSWDQEMEGSQSVSVSPRLGGTATKITLGMATSSRQPFSTHRRASSQGPPRKMHRNGLHKSRRRFGATDATGSRNSTGSGRKRPFFLIRTNPNANNTSTFATPGSVGSGRTSGSEPDDSTQYECDSEGTSTTTNSEVSVERLRKTHQLVTAGALQAQSKLGNATSAVEETNASLQCKTLQEVFRVSLAIVLDHSYKHCGGYKLSPAEKNRNETLSNDERRIPLLSSEAVFQQRRQRLLSMLLPDSPESSSRRRHGAPSEGPPFTIQRISEVLLSPERYYTQTHKLCNCLEKLILVRSSTGAFGGSTGGDTSQTRGEERERAALEDEKGRQESVLRQRRLRRRALSPSDETATDSSTEGGARSAGIFPKDDVDMNDYKKSPSREIKAESFDQNTQRMSPKGGKLSSNESSRELLEATARASLRTKFDHVEIDPHSSLDRDVRSIAENRGMTSSPPPPSLAMSVAPSNIALQGHTLATGFVRQHLPEQNSEHHIARVPSPILFSPGSESSVHATTNMHMLHLHHAVALAGVSLSRGAPSPLDLMSIDGAVQSHNNLVAPSENPDLETDHGRSSASNSDVDSESDDISLDDSASDRSDGSDSSFEPFTAARAMALNRMQQQQRLQSRVLTSFNALNQSEGFRPPADSEYQSGDSIDSTRAEDSGGSDSSSSDLAD